MKRVLVIAAALTVIGTSSAFAAKTSADSSGCGFGTQTFEGKKGVGPQLGAALLNGISANQLFGISFGTLGCNKAGRVTSPENVKRFASNNLDGLTRDIARGDGERLESLAELMGIDDQHKSTFFSVTQQNFATIFSSDNVTVEQVLASLQGVMAADPTLRRYVEV